MKRFSYKVTVFYNRIFDEVINEGIIFANSVADATKKLQDYYEWHSKDEKYSDFDAEIVDLYIKDDAPDGEVNGVYETFSNYEEIEQKNLARNSEVTS